MIEGLAVGFVPARYDSRRAGALAEVRDAHGPEGLSEQRREHHDGAGSPDRTRLPAIFMAVRRESVNETLHENVQHRRVGHGDVQREQLSPWL